MKNSYHSGLVNRIVCLRKIDQIFTLQEIRYRYQRELRLILKNEIEFEVRVEYDSYAYIYLLVHLFGF